MPGLGLVLRVDRYGSCLSWVCINPKVVAGKLRWLESSLFFHLPFLEVIENFFHVNFITVPFYFSLVPRLPSFIFMFSTLFFPASSNTICLFLWKIFLNCATLTSSLKFQPIFVIWQCRGENKHGLVALCGRQNSNMVPIIPTLSPTAHVPWIIPGIVNIMDFKFSDTVWLTLR